MGVEKRKRRKRRLSLRDKVDRQLFLQLYMENMVVSRALKLEEFRVKRRMDRQYVV